MIYSSICVIVCVCVCVCQVVCKWTMGEEDENESCGEDIKPVCKESTVPTEYIGEFLLFF